VRSFDDNDLRRAGYRCVMRQLVSVTSRIFPHCHQSILWLEPQPDALLEAIVPRLTLGVGVYYAMGRGWFFSLVRSCHFAWLP
jgi:hypothetical protein